MISKITSILKILQEIEQDIKAKHQNSFLLLTCVDIIKSQLFRLENLIKTDKQDV